MGNECNCLDNLTNNCGANLSRIANPFAPETNNDNNTTNNMINDKESILTENNFNNGYSKSKTEKKREGDNFSQNKNLKKQNYNNNTSYLESRVTETIKETYYNNNTKYNDIENTISLNNNENDDNKIYDNYKNTSYNEKDKEIDNYNIYNKKEKNIQMEKKEKNKNISDKVFKEVSIKLNKYFHKLLLKKKFENKKSNLLEEENTFYQKCLNYIYSKNKILFELEQHPPIKKYSQEGHKEYYSENILKQENNIPNKKESLTSSIYIKYKNDLEKIIENIESIYKGELTINNLPNGFGIKYNINGTKEIGTFIKGSFTGWNELIDSEGNIYRGFFINGILNGKGEKFIFQDKIFYKGNFLNSKFEGEGEEKNNEYYFKGNYINNEKKNGKMEFLLLSDIYEGEFKNNLFEGKGHYIYKNGNEYIGNFKEGKFNGEGKFKWSENEFYEGNFINGIREGKGKIHYKNGRSFIGNFSKGRPNGYGVFDNGFGFKKNVEFIDGKIKIERDNNDI